METKRYTISARFARSKGIPRTFIAIQERATQKAVKVKGRGTVEAHVSCMICGRTLTHPISRTLGIGPECGQHFYNVELTEANLEQLRQMIVDTVVDTWIPKSCIKSVENTDEVVAPSNNRRIEQPTARPTNETNNEIPMAIFNFHKDDRSFTQELSTLEGNGYKPYSKFAMVSESTGQRVVFYLKDTNTDREGDLTSLVYAPTPDSINRLPQVADLRVTLWND